jgi:hypothetical protein
MKLVDNTVMLYNYGVTYPFLKALSPTDHVEIVLPETSLITYSTTIETNSPPFIHKHGSQKQKQTGLTTLL